MLKQGFGPAANEKFEVMKRPQTLRMNAGRFFLYICASVAVVRYRWAPGVYLSPAHNNFLPAVTTVTFEVNLLTIVNAQVVLKGALQVGGVGKPRTLYAMAAFDEI